MITGLFDDHGFVNCIWQDDKMTSYHTPRTGSSRPGTGDLFASILIADALHDIDFGTSVKKAADFVALCIKHSEDTGTPIPEGVAFEHCLKDLIL